MQLTDLKISKSFLEFENKFVVLLQAKEYSPLFLSKVIKKYEHEHAIFAKKIDLDLDFVDIQKTLATTFLGERFLYWFTDISTISSKKKKTDWINFLKEYQGPHIIFGCLTDDVISSTDRVSIIQVQDSYTSDQVTKISLLYDGNVQDQTAYFVGKLYRYRKQYSIEQLCFLIQYASILGKNTDLFFEQWLDKMVISDVSLYWLSQLFFEKKANAFFEAWSLVRSSYPEQFWTSFFSDQLFKAYCFVSMNGRVEADQKNITFGLPFSFLKHDWKMYQLHSLQKAHQYIYQVDLEIKQGASSQRLDFFCMKFLQGL